MDMLIQVCDELEKEEERGKTGPPADHINKVHRGKAPSNVVVPNVTVRLNNDPTNPGIAVSSHSDQPCLPVTQHHHITSPTTSSGVVHTSQALSATQTGMCGRTLGLPNDTNSDTTSSKVAYIISTPIEEISKGAKLYKCSVCEFSTDRSDYVYEHVRRIHKEFTMKRKVEETRPNTKAKKKKEKVSSAESKMTFVTVVCTPTELLRMGGKMYKCSACELTSDETQSLYGHMKEAHKGLTVRKREGIAGSLWDEMDLIMRKVPNQDIGAAANLGFSKKESVDKLKKKQTVFTMKQKGQQEGMLSNDDVKSNRSIDNADSRRNVSFDESDGDNDDGDDDDDYDDEMSEMGFVTGNDGDIQADAHAGPLINDHEVDNNNMVSEQGWAMENAFASPNHSVRPSHEDAKSSLCDPPNALDGKDKVVRVIRNSCENRQNGEDAFKCSECGTSSHHSSALYKHMRRCHKDFKIEKLRPRMEAKCLGPSRDSANISHGEGRIVTVIRNTWEDRLRGEPPYRCSECGLSANHTTTLYKHMKARHKGFVIQKLTAIVGEPGERRRRKYGPRPKFVEIVKTPADLVAKGEKPYCCSRCGQSSDDTESLYLHMETMHKGCLINRQVHIGSVTTQHQNLSNINMEQHTPDEIDSGRKRYKCSFCDTYSEYPMQIQQHMQMAHAGLAIENAAESGNGHLAQRYSSKENRSSALSHEMVRAILLNTKLGIRYKCSKCAFILSSRGSFYNHAKRLHKDMKILYYSFSRISGSMSNARGSLEGLTKTVQLIDIKGHPKILFQCSRCALNFTNKPSAMRHLKTQHKGFAIVDNKGVIEMNCYGKSGGDANKYDDVDVERLLKREKEVIESGKFVEPIDIPKNGKGHKFKCSLCDTTSPETNSLYKHMRRRHKDFPILRRSNLHGIRMEFRDGNGDDDLFKKKMKVEKQNGDEVEECETNGRTVQILDIPSVEKPDKYHKYKCSKCDYTSDETGPIYKHMRRRHQGFTIVKKSDRNVNVDIDEKSIYVQDVPVEKTHRYKCSECQYTSRYPPPMYEHMKTKHRGFRIVRKSDLRKPGLKVKGSSSSKFNNSKKKGRYRCSLCEHTSNCKINLYRHMASCHEDCTIVKRTQTSGEESGSGAQHNEIHLGVAFENSGINTVCAVTNPVAGGDRYKCSLCDATSNVKDYLYRHMRHVHEDFVLLRSVFIHDVKGIARGTAENGIGAKFVYIVDNHPEPVADSGLDNTVYLIETPPRVFYVYRCSACDRTSYNRDILYRHMECRHKGLRITKDVQFSKINTEGLVENASTSTSIEGIPCEVGHEQSTSVGSNNGESLTVMDVSYSTGSGAACGEACDEESKAEVFCSSGPENSDEKRQSETVHIIASQKVKQTSFTCSACGLTSGYSDSVRGHIKSKHATMKHLTRLDVQKMNIPDWFNDGCHEVSSGFAENERSSNEEGNVNVPQNISEVERYYRSLYKCSECGYARSCTSSLYKHMKVHHKDFTIIRQSDIRNRKAVSQGKDTSKEGDVEDADHGTGATSEELSKKTVFMVATRVPMSETNKVKSGGFKHRCLECNFCTNVTSRLDNHIKHFHKEGSTSTFKSSGGVKRKEIAVTTWKDDKTDDSQRKTSKSVVRTKLDTDSERNNTDEPIGLEAEDSATDVEDAEQQSGDDSDSPMQNVLDDSEEEHFDKESGVKTVRVIDIPVEKSHQYKCSLCALTSCATGDLYRHMRNKHKDFTIVKKREKKENESGALSKVDEDEDRSSNIVRVVDIPVTRTHAYKCSECGKTGGNTSLLYKHMKRFHKGFVIVKKTEGNKVKSGGFKHRCLECNFGTNFTSRLDNHIKHFHTEGSTSTFKTSGGVKRKEIAVTTWKDDKTDDSPQRKTKSVVRTKLDTDSERSNTDEPIGLEAEDSATDVEDAEQQSGDDSDSPMQNVLDDSEEEHFDKESGVKTVRVIDIPVEKSHQYKCSLCALTSCATGDLYRHMRNKHKDFTIVKKREKKENESGALSKVDEDEDRSSNIVRVVDIPVTRTHAFKCSECGKTGGNTSLLYKHMKRFHKGFVIVKKTEGNKVKSGGFKHRCLECNFGTNFTSRLDNHIKHFHTEGSTSTFKTSGGVKRKEIAVTTWKDDKTNDSPQRKTKSVVRTKLDTDSERSNTDEPIGLEAEDSATDVEDAEQQSGDDSDSPMQNVLDDSEEEHFDKESGVKTVRVIDIPVEKSHQYKCSLCALTSCATGLLYRHMRNKHKDFTIVKKREKKENESGALSKVDEDRSSNIVRVVDIPVTRTHAFKCSECGKTGSNTSLLYKHMKRFHKGFVIVKKTEGNEVKSGGFKHRCLECNFGTNFTSRLDNHIKHFHTEGSTSTFKTSGGVKRKEIAVTTWKDDKTDDSPQRKTKSVVRTKLDTDSERSNTDEPIGLEAEDSATDVEDAEQQSGDDSDSPMQNVLDDSEEEHFDKESGVKTVRVIDIPVEKSHQYKCSLCALTSCATGLLYRHMRNKHKDFTIVKKREKKENESGALSKVDEDRSSNIVRVVDIPVTRTHAFKCSECGKTGSNTSLLYKHMKRFHKGFVIVKKTEGNEVKSGGFKHRCLECNFGTNFTSRLDNHIKHFHTEGSTSTFKTSGGVKRKEIAVTTWKDDKTDDSPQRKTKSVVRTKLDTDSERSNTDEPIGLEAEDSATDVEDAEQQSGDDSDSPMQNVLDDSEEEHFDKESGVKTVRVIDIPVEKSHQYKCSLCALTSCATGLLYRHMRNKHKDFTIVKKREKKENESGALSKVDEDRSSNIVRVVDIPVTRTHAFKCSECGKTGSNTSLLYKHMKRFHKGFVIVKKTEGNEVKSGGFKHRCLECNFGTNFTSRLDNHIKHFHKEGSTSTFKTSGGVKRKEIAVTTWKDDKTNDSPQRKTKSVVKTKLDTDGERSNTDEPIGLEAEDSATDVEDAEQQSGDDSDSDSPMQNVLDDSEEEHFDKESGVKTVRVIDIPVEKSHQYKCSLCALTSCATGLLYRHMRNKHKDFTIVKKREKENESGPSLSKVDEDEDRSSNIVRVVDIPVTRTHAYKCSECGKTGGNTSLLYKHMKRFHKGFLIVKKTNTKKNSLDQTLRDKVVNERSNKEANAKTVQRVSNRLNQVSVGRSNKEANAKMVLRGHHKRNQAGLNEEDTSVRSVHVVDVPVARAHQYKCSECDKTSDSTGALYSHMRTFHKGFTIIKRRAGIEKIITKNGKDSNGHSDGRKSSKTVKVIDIPVVRTHRFKCSECDKTSDCTSTLYKHMKVAHKGFVIIKKTDAKKLKLQVSMFPKARFNVGENAEIQRDCKKQHASSTDEGETSMKRKRRGDCSGSAVDKEKRTVGKGDKSVENIPSPDCDAHEMASIYDDDDDDCGDGGDDNYNEDTDEWNPTEVKTGRSSKTEDNDDTCFITDQLEDQSLEMSCDFVRDISSYECCECMAAFASLDELDSHVTNHCGEKSNGGDNSEGTGGGDSGDDDDDDGGDSGDDAGGDAEGCMKDESVTRSGWESVVYIVDRKKSRSHSWKCSQCNKTSNDRRILHKHMMAHHKGLRIFWGMGDKGDKELCQRPTDTHHQPSVQVVRIPPLKIPRYKCSACDTTSDYTSTLYRHMKVRHKDLKIIRDGGNGNVNQDGDEAVVTVIDIPCDKKSRRKFYKCSRCDWTSYNLSVLYKHMKIHHRGFKIVKRTNTKRQIGFQTAYKKFLDKQSVEEISEQGLVTENANGNLDVDNVVDDDNDGNDRHSGAVGNGDDNGVSHSSSSTDLGRGRVGGKDAVDENILFDSPGGDKGGEMDSSCNTAPIVDTAPDHIENETDTCGGDTTGENSAHCDDNAQDTVSGGGLAESSKRKIAHIIDRSFHSTYKYQCSECGHIKNGYDNLYTHIKSFHKGFRIRKIYNCGDHKDNGNLKPVQVMDARGEDGEKRYKCSECGFNSRRLESLQTHIKSAQKFKIRRESNRFAVEKEENMSFKTISAIRLPWKGELRYKCSLCFYCSGYISAMYRHMRSHHKGFDFIKPFDGKLEVNPVSSKHSNKGRSANKRGIKRTTNENNNSDDASDDSDDDENSEDSSAQTVEIVDLNSDGSRYGNVQYKCSRCEETSTSVTSLYHHMRKKHKSMKILKRSDHTVQIIDVPDTGRGRHKCSECSQVSRSTTIMYKHMQRKHKGFKILKKLEMMYKSKMALCTVSGVQLEDFTITSEGEKRCRYKCSDCDTSMTSLTRLYNHIQRVHVGATLKAKKNDELKAVSTSGKEDRRKKKTSGQTNTVRIVYVPDVERKYVCSLCRNVTTALKKAMFTHVRKVHPDSKAIFENVDARNDDDDADEKRPRKTMEVLDFDVDENGTQLYKCSLCSETSNIVTRLYNHMRQDHLGFELIKRTDLSVRPIYVPDAGKGRYKCSECNSIRLTRSHLYRHMRIKHPSFRIVTKSGRVGVSYKSNSNPAKRKSRAHKAFRIPKVSDERNVKIVHAIDLIPPVGQFRYQCSECGKLTATVGAIYSHVRHIHKGFRLVKKKTGSELIPDEESSSSEDESTVTRGRTVTVVDVPSDGEPWYKCSLCFKPSRYTGALYRHMKRAHPRYKIVMLNNTKRRRWVNEMRNNCSIIMDTARDLEVYLCFKEHLFVDSDDDSDHDDGDDNGNDTQQTTSDIIPKRIASPRISSYECCLCMELFTSGDDLDKHVIDAHNNNDNDTPPAATLNKKPSIFDYVSDVMS